MIDNIRLFFLYGKSVLHREAHRVCPPLSQELQAQLEEEVRSHEEHREEQAALERRCALLVSEGEETRSALESAERARKALETELQDANEKYSDLNNQVICGLFAVVSCRG